MSAVPKRKKMSVAEYLAIERAAAFKSEFFDGEMFAMAGAGRKHNVVKDNLIVEIGMRLRGTPCRTVSSDQRLAVDDSGLYTYPDILIVCGPMISDRHDEETVVNPTVLLEILSPSTAHYDRGSKFRRYQKIASLKEYVLVAQDEAVVERFVRQGDGSWALVSFVGLEASLALTSVAVQIPLADIYAGVEFEQPNQDEGAVR